MAAGHSEECATFSGRAAANSQAASSENFRTLNIVVGVAGGIAAYKSCHLVREFKERGHNVTVVPTRSALKFVGAATFEALSGNPVATDVFEYVDEVRHVRVGQEADLVVIAPATADVLSRITHGRADDMLTATVLVTQAPVVLAPAMHTEMWLNPATQDNVATLRQRGITVLPPAHGRLTGKDTGPGRLPEPNQIAALALTAASNRQYLRQDLAGKRVLITAGGTQEAIDPVRFIGNHSSGRQGFAIAEVAAARGAEVMLVAGDTDDLTTPISAEVIRVRSAEEMADAVAKQLPKCEVAIFAAAVADYRPKAMAASKLKKGSADKELATLELIENPDILRTSVQSREAGEISSDTILVGFAAETGDGTKSALELAQEKLARKGCDLLLANDVSGGATFGADDNQGWILKASGEVTSLAKASKFEVAARLLDACEF